MRPYELLLLGAIGAAALATFQRERLAPWQYRLITLLPVIAALLHLQQEGLRWQMVPAYAAVLLIAAARLEGVARLMGTLAAVGAGLSLLLIWLLPVINLPTPDGPYPVGTTVRHLVDESRLEFYSDEPDDPREIVYQLWYPADPNSGVPAPWTREPEVLTPALARILRLPDFTLGYLRYVQANAVPEAPLAAAAERWPLLLYLHGWSGFRGIAAHDMERLASHGYVVVAADHAYGALVTRFPDGEVASLNPDALPSGVSEAEYDVASTRLEATFAADAAAILDDLAQNGGPFAERLDLTRVGVIGHSTGGGAAVTLCAADGRCAALLGQDPWVEPVPQETIAAGLDIPLLFVRSEGWVGNDNDRPLRRLYEASTARRYWMSIDGTAHRDFTLQPALSPLVKLVGLSGPLDTNRTFQINGDLLLGFFDQVLRDRPSALLDGDSPYPELRRERD